MLCFLRLDNVTDSEWWKRCILRAVNSKDPGNNDNNNNRPKRTFPSQTLTLSLLSLTFSHTHTHTHTAHTTTTCMHAYTTILHPTHTHTHITCMPTYTPTATHTHIILYYTIHHCTYAHTLSHTTLHTTHTAMAEKGFKRLRTILQPILLRRTKDQQYYGKPLLLLPTKTLRKIVKSFSKEEQLHYDSIYGKAKVRFNQLVQKGSVMKNYSTILTMLLRLRQICDHPSLAVKNKTSPQGMALFMKLYSNCIIYYILENFFIFVRQFALFTVLFLEGCHSHLIPFIYYFILFSLFTAL